MKTPITKNAITNEDEKTFICNDCGINETRMGFFIAKERRDKIPVEQFDLSKKFRKELGLDWINWWINRISIYRLWIRSCSGNYFNYYWISILRSKKDWRKLKNSDDIFFDFLIALHSMKKVGAQLTGFYGIPVKDNKYELRLVLQKWKPNKRFVVLDVM